MIHHQYKHRAHKYSAHIILNSFYIYILFYNNTLVLSNISLLMPFNMVLPYFINPTFISLELIINGIFDTIND